MSKVIILGDMHIGARNASTVVAEHQLSFYETDMFPYMVKHNIYEIVQLGDVFDTRKFTNHIVLREWKKRFFDVLPGKMHIILGNHDLATKNTTEINTPSILLSEYVNLNIIDAPTEIMLGDLMVQCVPWMCLENYNDCMTAINTTKALWCMGHFEIDGMQMHQGQVHEGGLSLDTFKRFEHVMTGHFHTRNSNKNVMYTGTPYEMSWIDYNDPKGFHVLDTETRELKFIKASNTLFKKIFYDDSVPDGDLPDVSGCYIKVMVVKKTNDSKFEKFIAKLALQDPADLKIVEDSVDLDADTVDDDVLEMEDTLSLIESYIDGSDVQLDKVRVKQMMGKIYIESLEALT